MPRDKSKHRIVTFKAEEELAAFLDEMPNKSDFIRKALLSALMEPCPVCQGKGQRPAQPARRLRSASWPRVTSCPAPSAATNSRSKPKSSVRAATIRRA